MMRAMRHAAALRSTAPRQTCLCHRYARKYQIFSIIHRLPLVVDAERDEASASALPRMALADMAR
jgi:hypothetical protein